LSQHFEVHPQNPQPRLLKQAAAILQAGGIAAVPTDSSYALVCRLDDKAAAENMRRIRQVDDKHHLTLLCRDLSELARFARTWNVSATASALELDPEHIEDFALMPVGSPPDTGYCRHVNIALR